MLISLPEIIQKYNLDIKAVIHLGASEGQERFIYDSMGVAVIWVEAIPSVYVKLYDNVTNIYNLQYPVQACIGKDISCFK